MQAAKSADEDFLSDILRVLTMPQHPIAQAKDGTLKPCYERAHLRPITFQATLDQCRIFFVHGKIPFWLAQQQNSESELHSISLTIPAFYCGSFRGD